jgi:hypothetical protein
MRLLEALPLRVKDLDLSGGRITVLQIDRHSHFPPTPGTVERLGEKEDSLERGQPTAFSTRTKVGQR